MANRFLMTTTFPPLLSYDGDIFDILTIGTGDIPVSLTEITINNTGSSTIYGVLTNKRMLNGNHTADVTKVLIFVTSFPSWCVVTLTTPITTNLETYSELFATPVMPIDGYFPIGPGTDGVLFEVDLPDYFSIIDGYDDHDKRINAWNMSILRAGRSKLPGVYLDEESDADFTGSIQ